MINLTISIFKNKILLEIINELKLFSELKIEYIEDFDFSLENSETRTKIFVLFFKNLSENFLDKIKNRNIPSILITENNTQKKILLGELQEQISIPFSVLDFKKKIISLIAKNEFRKNSFIKLNDYIIDKNERKIKKNDLELQLSEKEINFLILFSKKRDPISRNFVLKKVWNYSSESETHTVETHIHRLRKKIFEKFGDNNFIKNNNKGYYI